MLIRSKYYMKRCLICGQEKPEEEYGINRARRDGLMPSCKPCSNEKKRRLVYTDPHYAELNRKYGRAWFRDARVKALNLLGGKCVVCGFDDARALQIDHIGGGGLQEMKKLSYYQFYKRLLTLQEAELKKKYQILCANHNMIKKAEKREYFHREGIAVPRQHKHLTVKSLPID